MQQYCGNCGKKLEMGMNFCSSCGKPIMQEQGISANQQNNLMVNNVNKKGGTYKLITGIIMIILASCVLLAGTMGEEGSLMIYIIPGFLGLVAGILNICSRTRYNLLKVSGILFIIAAVVNFFGIYDISLYAILSIVCGIINLFFKKDNV